METHKAVESPRSDGIESALAVVAFFQNNVAQADTKIGFLCVAQVGFAMALVNGGGTGDTGPLPVALPVLVCAFAFLVAGYHLVRALRPRLRFHSGGRAVTGFPRPRPRQPLTSDEVWRMAEILSGIALEKNRHIRRCIPWLALMLVVIVANGLAERAWG
ncbi:hypothetical protein [Nocardiopsis alborubida]|uniref:Pycsar effector protein domain-containing protein n=1 Tax=Nocardiopsis alborubida TaxID=146802 RepID=A0A7X6RR61_9ACTN|nr:hypothetical protein [Nocardiopsis alborubida]NKY99625.1 hypothetical protein [Nocardiopsis alborubida]